MTAAPRAVAPSVNGWNAEYLESQYQRWKSDPESVTADMAQFFRGFDLAAATAGQVRLGTGGGGGNGSARAWGTGGGAGGRGGRGGAGSVGLAVERVLDAYRRYGHLGAATDPFGREPERPVELTRDQLGLGALDLDSEVDGGHLTNGRPIALRALVEALEATYCGSIGIEFMHSPRGEERAWWSERMESGRGRRELERGERAHVLYQLHRAEMFERFCAKRYVGVKRFSLEGGDSLIPMLDRIVERAADAYHIEEIIFAMSHRGRLNVLTNIIGKTYEKIFTEFEDAWHEDSATGGGDVKYHRGYSSNRVLPSGRHIWLSMSSNPSHLEAVGPVAIGRCRAKQRLRGDTERKRVIPIVMHGDAAMIGQGVVAETFTMAGLRGYTVGGTVHVVVNNLIGFTTGPQDARSSTYCTDFAKTIDAPVLHVNGEDPEAVVFAAELALDYRMAFKRDVVIDMVCYRKHGHNETDEAAFTQPLLYNQIKSKPSVLKTYAERLLAEGVISEKDMNEIRSSLEENLDKAYTQARQTPVDPTPDPGHQQWVGLSNTYTHAPIDTAVTREALDEVARAMGRWPEPFTPHPKLEKLLGSRAQVVEQDLPIDWGTAESLAYGSLLIEGVLVRMSGQDCGRGTFSHRHAVLIDNKTADRYVPLNHIREVGVPGTDKDVGTVNEAGVRRQAKLCLYDSPLSEFAVLGFEYGFSLASPKMLVLWEAQFGDFSNGAQVVIDQFIASAESKWHRWSGLVMLLPHGYEGQGPEHSSARLERYLKLCGQDNLQVCMPTTPAQQFHLLRRQVLRRFRKPLIVMSPKSLLRLPAAASRVEDLTGGRFMEVLDDPAFSGGDAKAKRKVKRILLCSGKVYYDLIERREQSGKDGEVAVVRVEQLYPLHSDLLRETIESYPNADLYWVQEEPKNMGAYGHMFISLHQLFGWSLAYIGRQASASPATGSPSKHEEELNAFLTEAVGPVVRTKDSEAGSGGGEEGGGGVDPAEESKGVGRPDADSSPKRRAGSGASGNGSGSSGRGARSGGKTRKKGGG
ncbi:MAG: 2-oxoglutarate dehydrogenase E1 component [Phycisphaerales bacterium]